MLKKPKSRKKSEFTSPTPSPLAITSEVPKVKVFDTTKNYEYITTDTELKEIVASLVKEKVLAIDTETTGLCPHQNRLRLVQIASDTLTVVIDAFKCDIRLIQPLLSTNILKVFQNAKFDIKFFMALGLEIDTKFFDTMIASELTNAGKKINNSRISCSLATLAKTYLDIDLDKSCQKSAWNKKELTSEQLEYSAKDVEILLPLRQKLRQKLIDLGLVEVAKIEFDCILAVAEKEFNGILFDFPKWQSILKGYENEKKDLLRYCEGALKPPAPKEIKPIKSQLSLMAIAKKEIKKPVFNIDSPKQLKEALNRLNIPVEKTDIAELAKFSDNPLIEKLIRYKYLRSLFSKTGDNLKKHQNLVTGRLHTSFFQMGAETGRFTSRNPNLQQIRREKNHRACFVPKFGYKFLIADYSQIELRIAAEIAKEDKMIKAFCDGQDLHVLTASLVLGKALGDVTKGDRQLAKATNFGLLYGQGVKGFIAFSSSSYGVNLTEKEAHNIRNKFFSGYPRLAEWQKETKSKVFGGIKQVRTLSGRTRHFDAPKTQDALNTPIQGLGADILKIALANVSKAIRNFDCYLVLSVHDEIILECKENQAKDVAVILSGCMESAGRQFLKTVPIKADTTICDNWSEK